MNPVSAIGGPAAVSTSDRFSADAAASVLRKGGSAVDALIAAAAVQCVVSNGTTTIAGMWISNSYDSASGRVTTVSSKIGPAQDENYDYNMDSLDAYGGRSMPVPAWVTGAYRAWEHGGRLKWADLFEHAIVLADAYECNLSAALRVRPGLSMPLAARTAEGRAIWMPEGRYIEPGEPVRQPALARTLRALAADGPAAFYEGEFAREYVATSRRLGGRLTMADMAAGKDRAVVRRAVLMGDYLGHQVVTEGGLMVYALHLAQAADLEALDEVESVYAQVRIMEEVFHSTRQYSAATHDQFTNRTFAESRIEEVLSGPVRPMAFELFWANTEVLVVRDNHGNMAWLVHSINTSTMFGAGILVGGAYAVRVLSKGHAVSGDLLRPGLFAHLGLFRDGKPHLVAASPGWGIMHATIGFVIGVMQRRLDPLAALQAPRFGLPSPMTANAIPFESHYSTAVFEMLKARSVPYFDCAPSLLTGRLAAMVVDDDRVHAVQEQRADDGVAMSFSGE